MIEAGACEVSEADMLQAIIKGHQEIIGICDLLQTKDEIGKEKFAYESVAVPEEVMAESRDTSGTR